MYQYSKSAMVIGLFLSILMTSCQGARVSGNGFFDSRNEVLKEALIGKWEASGEEKILFEFSEVEKGIKMLVDDEEREMFDFNCDGDIRFSFGYLNSNSDTVYVAAQFKTYDMKTLVGLQSPQNESSSEVSFFNLNRKLNVEIEEQQ
ncbi:hypothetical protein MB14_14455 [Roseivirga ehrenbergii]|uniref:Lipocalin-like domain-containing protein n=2 Tax=Roseivirga ehrenbergii (strain DSM 102268 / JCM 13514 / KCTC 12282 / NCIMB 14502 / KMM 6017) TaxID=279360 RepID=A0A150XQX0_ROSEK|nr:hypothetical protein [Roseivirga ehrenbergii]KYG80982.1 hypothetical protein MB14_14455 [Roseivirga ehrenbergii]